MDTKKDNEVFVRPIGEAANSAIWQALVDGGHNSSLRNLRFGEESIRAYAVPKDIFQSLEEGRKKGDFKYEVYYLSLDGTVFKKNHPGQNKTAKQARVAAIIQARARKSSPVEVLATGFLNVTSKKVVKLVDGDSIFYDPKDKRLIFFRGAVEIISYYGDEDGVVVDSLEEAKVLVRLLISAAGLKAELKEGYDDKERLIGWVFSLKSDKAKKWFIE